jgi:hypothetical protein
MNETNPLETQLRLWKPRRPSVRVERRLFPRAHPKRAPLAATLNLLAPAAACLLLAASLLKPQGDGSLPAAGGEPMLAMILSNQSYAAYLPGSFQREQNRWDTFEWTNRGASGSSVAPFSPRLRARPGQD